MIQLVASLILFDHSSFYALLNQGRMDTDSTVTKKREAGPNLLIDEKQSPSKRTKLKEESSAILVDTEIAIAPNHVSEDGSDSTNETELLETEPTTPSAKLSTYVPFDHETDPMIPFQHLVKEVMKFGEEMGDYYDLEPKEGKELTLIVDLTHVDPKLTIGLKFSTMTFFIWEFKLMIQGKNDCFTIPIKGVTL
jgi:hypothetical protein